MNANAGAPAAGGPEGLPARDLQREAADFGMKLLLLSLSILFIASIVGYVYIRLRNSQWPPEGSPPLPPGLWTSAALLVLASAAVQAAAAAAGKGSGGVLKTALGLTFALGAGYVVSQIVVWGQFFNFSAKDAVNIYGFGFLFLTGVHAAHVAGGLVFALVALAVSIKRPVPAAAQTARHCAAYWHFLGVAWFVILAVLYLV